MKACLPPNPPKVVIIGDSILRDVPLPELRASEQYDQRVVYRNLYPDQAGSSSYVVSQEFVDSYKPYTSMIYVNPGITADRLQARIQANPDWLRGASRCVLLVGTNDINSGLSAEDTFKSICAIEKDLKQRHASLATSWICLLPRTDYVQYQAFYDLNTMIHQKFKQNCVNLYRKFWRKTPKLELFYEEDPIHPNPEGARCIADSVGRHLEFVFK